MPAFTPNSNIPYPLGGDPIRGSVQDNVRTDLEDLAKAADLADMASRAGAVVDAKDQLEPRIQFAERLAAEPGTWTMNHIIDPKPLDPATNYTPGRCTLTAAPGWGRAICNANGATYFTPHAGSDAVVEAPAIPGGVVAVSVDIRAMTNQNMDANLTLAASTIQDGAKTNRTIVAETGMLTVLSTVGSRKFSIEYTLPAGTSFNHVEARVQFTRTGSTYPDVGDWVYWRNFLLAPAVDLSSTPSISYFDGDSTNSYWEGEPNASPSITATARGLGGGGAGGGLQRSAIVDAGIKRRGGRIGTNGKAAIALRFDHHFAQFDSKVMPLLRANRLPWGQMTNIGNFGSGNNTLTVAQVAALCYTSGGELWNHSLTHSDIPNPAVADREVTQGLADLKAAFPQLWIDGWAGPGQPDLMGMEGSDTPEKFYGTYPGQLVLRQHAFVRGYYPGIYQPMSLPNLVGAPHTTIDTLDFAYVSGLIRGAQSSKAGLTLMLHPNYLDTPGYMTTAALTQILSFIAAERDAGELVVLSTTGILLADSSTDERQNLATSGAAATLSGTWSETITGRASQVQYGVPHELTVHVRAVSSGAVTLNLSESGLNKRFDQTHTVSLSAGQFVTLRCLATFPIDTAGVTASLTGNVDHSTIKLHAV